MTHPTTSSRSLRLLFAATLGLLGSAPAQQPGEFFLPAGVHTNRQLANLLELVERQPLRASLCNPDATVSLQRASSFAAEDMARFLRAVLDESGALHAETTTTTVASADPIAEVTMLRPFVGAPDGEQVLRTVPLEAAIELSGSPAQVDFAERLLELIGGEVPVEAHTFAWDERQMSWPGGQMRTRQFVRYFAAALDVNVIGEVPDGVVELGDPATVSPREWVGRASVAAFEAGVWLAQRLPAQRLFVVRDTGSRSCTDLLHHADVVSAARVGEHVDASPVSIVVELRQVQPIAAVQQLMPRMRAGAMTAVGTIGDQRLLMCGPRFEVAEFVATLRRLDALR